MRESLVGTIELSQERAQTLLNRSTGKDTLGRGSSTYRSPEMGWLLEEQKEETVQWVHSLGPRPNLFCHEMLLESPDPSPSC